MIIAVTGGDGFIGRYVQSRLRELDIEPVVFDINYDITNDVTDRESVEEFLGGGQTDAVIHLAGLLGTHELWDTAEDAIDVNIKGGLNVGRWCADNDVKMVSIEQPHIWYNVYEASKLAVRRMLTGLHYDQGLRVDFVTAHNAFGPGQAYGDGHPRKILPTFSTQAWAGGPIEIWGTGRQQVNLVYAGDVADALVRRALAETSYPLTHYQAGVDELRTVHRVACDVGAYVTARTGEEVKVEFIGSRLGEQGIFDYPPPDHTYPYRLDSAKFDATIESYRP